MLTGKGTGLPHAPDPPLSYGDGRNQRQVPCSELSAHVFEPVHLHRRSSVHQGKGRLHSKSQTEDRIVYWLNRSCRMT